MYCIGPEPYQIYDTVAPFNTVIENKDDILWSINSYVKELVGNAYIEQTLC